MDSSCFDNDEYHNEQQVFKKFFVMILFMHYTKTTLCISVLLNNRFRMQYKTKFLSPNFECNMGSMGYTFFYKQPSTELLSIYAKNQY